MRRSISLTAAVIVAITATAGCSSTSSSGAGGNKNVSSSKLPQAKSSKKPTVDLIWSKTVDEFGDKAVLYVARVANPNSSPASVAIDAHALDKTDTIVGSDTETLPNVPARGTFDYFGILGSVGEQLTGTPAKITVGQAKDAFGQAGAVDQPMLKTSELKLSKGSKDDLIASVPYSYNLSVKVTNSTKDTVTGGVTQQVVLYDKAGHVVGGDSGSSDNVPDSLPAGASYREQWTGIPALHPAVRAVYTVWPG